MATRAGTTTVAKPRKATIMMFLKGRAVPLRLASMAIINLTISTVSSACKQKKALWLNSPKTKMVVSWLDLRGASPAGRK